MLLGSIVCLLGAYLLGAVPFGLLIARARGIDVRQVGSGNIGATNAARALGKKVGALVLLLDAAKAALPVLWAMRWGNELPWLAADARWLPHAMGLAAVCGHVFPIYLRFRGGKGVASALGAFLVLEPKAALIGAALYVACVVASRVSAVGSLIAVVSFPLVLALTGAAAASYYLAASLALLIVVRHHQNIRRLLKKRREPM